jgi:hypothetical protein
MRNSKFDRWRKRARSRLPELSARVFALRGKEYPGCGFHYAMERRLGNVVSLLSDLEHRPTFDDEVLMEISMQMLFEDVVEAEGGKR